MIYATYDVYSKSRCAVTQKGELIMVFDNDNIPIKAKYKKPTIYAFALTKSDVLVGSIGKDEDENQSEWIFNDDE